MEISHEHQDGKVPETPQQHIGVILVAEDEMDLRDSISDMLRVFGYDSILAKNASELLEKFYKNKDRITLIFSDIMMPPGMTGIDAAKQVRESGSNVPIILSSAAHERHHLELLISESVITGILPKPYDVETVDGLLKSILGSEPTIEP